jgi:hypothetical protein
VIQIATYLDRDPASEEHELRVFDRLIETLVRAEDGFRSGSPAESEAAPSEGLAAVGALYGSLDVAAAPEVARHLGALYDTCVRALGEAYAGNADGLVAATRLLRAIRASLTPRQTRPADARRAA